MAPSKTYKNTRTIRGSTAGRKAATAANRVIPDSQPDEVQTRKVRKRKATREAGRDTDKRSRTLDSEPDTPALRRSTRPKNLLQQQFESSPVLPALVRNQKAAATHMTPDVEFSAVTFDTDLHSRQPDVLTRFRQRESSPTRPTLGALIPATSSPLRSSPRLRPRFSPTRARTTRLRPGHASREPSQEPSREPSQKVSREVSRDTSCAPSDILSWNRAIQQFRTPLLGVVAEAKRLMRDWTIFQSPLPDTYSLILETATVVQMAKEAGSNPTTSFEENQSEYLPYYVV